MPKLLKKFVLSFLSALILVFSSAPYFAVSAADCNPVGATMVCPGQTVCSVGLDRYCCTTAAACTQFRSSQPPSTPTVGTTWYNQGLGDWFLKVYDTSNPSEIFGERYTAAQVQWVIYGLISYIVNIPFGSKGGAIFACLLGTPAANQGLSACLGPAIMNLFADNPQLLSNVPAKTNQSLLSLVFASDRPISGISYARSSLQKFSLVPVANAQTPGFGFSALSSVQDFWTNTRNIAFGMFVIVAIVFSFMIMFRVKINPQTVVTIQSAIPKVIIALILVTFSYAIAGFLIDFMYVVIGLVSLVTANLIPNVTILGIPLQTANYGPSDVFNLLTIGPVTDGNAGGIFGFLITYTSPLLIILTIAFLLAVALMIGTGGAAFFPVLIVLVLISVVLIVVIWMTLKTIWTLFKATANVLLLTIFAPMYLSLGTLVPNLGFGNWVKSYVSHLAVFVVSGVMLLFAWIFQLMAWQGLGGDALTILSSETIAIPWPPLLGTGGGVSLVFAGVSFVMFTLIPKSADLVQSFISGKPFAYGSAIGEAINPMGATGYAGAYGVGKVSDRITERMNKASLAYKGIQVATEAVQKKLSKF